MMTGSQHAAAALNGTFSSLSSSMSAALSTSTASAGGSGPSSSCAGSAEGNNVQVIVRCRPPSDAERRVGDAGVIGCLNGNEVHVLSGSGKAKAALGGGGKKVYTFDQSYGALSSQEEVYARAVQPLVEEVLAGFNCTVFAYGQTGTGKTYTMEGELTADIGSRHAGVIPRSVHTIFDVLEHQALEYSVKVSFLELYNEELTDLLAEEDGGGQSGDTKELRIFEDPSGKRGMLVNNLEEVIVTSASEVFTALQKSWQKRRTAETLLNKNSSRSHCVFIITVHTKECDEDGEDIIKTGKLYLVDLAGSECVGKSGAQNQRAKEAGKINQSLLTLGRVINALVDKSSYIPYRDSKLTRLLQESLGGRAKTVIIATVSPSLSALDETLSTLEYAHRAKNIRNRPQVNQKMSKRAYMKELLAEINSLKRDNEALRLKNGIFLPPEKYELMVSQQRGDSLRLEELVFAIKAKEAEFDALQATLTDRDAQLSAVTAERDHTHGRLQATQDSLQACEQSLHSTQGQLHATSAALRTTSAALAQEQVKVEEGLMLLQAHARTEEALTAQATSLVHSVEAVVADKERLHDKVARKDALERANAQRAQLLADSTAQQRDQIARDARAFATDYTAAHGSAQARVQRVDAISHDAAAAERTQTAGWSAAWRVQKDEMAFKAAAYAAASQRGFDDFAGQCRAADDEAQAQLSDLHDLSQQRAQRAEQSMAQQELYVGAVLDGRGRFLSAAAASSASFEDSTTSSLAALSSVCSAGLSESASSLSTSLSFLSTFVAEQDVQRARLRQSVLESVQRAVAEQERAHREQLAQAVSTLSSRLQEQRAHELRLQERLVSDAEALTGGVRAWSAEQQRGLSEEQTAVQQAAEEWRRLALESASEVRELRALLSSSVRGVQAHLSGELERSRTRGAEWSDSLRSFHADAEQHAQHLDALQAAAVQRLDAHADDAERALREEAEALSAGLCGLQSAVAAHVERNAGQLRAVADGVVRFVAHDLQTDVPSGRTPEKRKLSFITQPQLSATQPHAALLDAFRHSRKHKHQRTDSAQQPRPADAAAEAERSEPRQSVGHTPPTVDTAQPHPAPAQSSPPPPPLLPAPVPQQHSRQLSASSALSRESLSGSGVQTAASSSIPVLSLRSSSRLNVQQSAPAAAAAQYCGGAGGALSSQSSENTPPQAPQSGLSEQQPPAQAKAASASSFIPAVSKPTLRSASRLRFGPAAAPAPIALSDVHMATAAEH